MSAPAVLTAGDVVRYKPDERHDPWWCREGQAITLPDGRLADTFWSGLASDPHILTDAERATAEVIFNLADYDELDRYRKHDSKATWEKYAPTDRQTVTSQHGLEVRWFVRKGAAEDLPTQLANAWAEVQAAKRKVESAVSDLQFAQRQHARLEMQSEATR